MPIIAAVPTISAIASNAVRYIVSGSARSALKKVIKELNNYYTKGRGKHRKVKPSAKAIEERAKRWIAEGTKKAKEQAPSAGKKSIKQGGAFSQTSKTAGITPLRIKDSGKLIPRTKTKAGSIPLKTAQQPKPGISTKVKKPTLTSFKKGKKDKKSYKDIQEKRNKYSGISDKVVTPFNVKKLSPAKKANLTRLQKLVGKVKRNKVKTIAGVGLATSAIVATNKLRKGTSKKTTESSKKIQQRNSGADQKFIRTNFASPKNLENYRGRRGGINVRKKKKK